MSKFVYSYCGYYKNMYLRSSYEYVFCKILEYRNVNYKIEAESYYLENGKYYIPDFFIYDKDWNLIKIVEVKSEAKSLKCKGLENLRLLQKITDVPCSIYFLKDLERLGYENHLDVKKLIEEWKLKNFSKKRSIISDPVKKAIGVKTKERMDDPIWKAYWKSKIKESAKNWAFKLEGERVDRLIKICPKCGSKFKVLPSSNKIYCSRKCASIYTAKIANEIKVNNNNNKKDKIRNLFFYKLKEFENLDKQKLKDFIILFSKECGYKDVRPLAKILINKYTKNIDKIINNLDIS